MKTRTIIILIVTAVILSVWIYVFYLIDKHKITVDGVIMSCLVTIATWLLIAACISLKWRWENGIDLFVKLESNPEKVKEHMLFIMQFGHTEGIKGALKEFNDIFRNYPQWELEKWEVFRAWYKDLIDHALEKPEIYILTMKDGSEYSKESDPLYDSDAPSWEQFDRKRYYDDDNEDDDNEDYDNDTPNLKKAAKDGFMKGVGFGLANFIINGNK